MKMSTELEKLILSNYKGSILRVESDINIFFTVKRMLKKNIVHDSMKETPKLIKTLINHIKTLLNIFDITLIDAVFYELLDDKEKIHYNTIKSYMNLELYPEINIDVDFLEMIINA